MPSRQPDGKMVSDSVEVTNPVIVVKVLSPGTQVTDLCDKLRGHFTIPSVHHYLIVLNPPVKPHEPRVYCSSRCFPAQRKLNSRFLG
jgi:hypothetical protein